MNYAQPIPMFPLPNCVFFPHALLPLHIFEPRYRAMLAYAMEHHQLIAMALIDPDAADTPNGQPAIARTLCVGRVVSHEGLPDGRSNVVLQGVSRATLRSEKLAAAGYRLARLGPVDTSGCTSDTCEHQAMQSISTLLAAPGFAENAIAQQILQLIEKNASLSVVTDLVAFHLLPYPRAQQALLDDPDAASRASLLSRLLAAVGTQRLAAPISGSAALLN